MSTVIKNIEREEDHNESAPCVPYMTEAIVIIGAGPVGIHLVNELSKKQCVHPVIIYGDEAYKPYDRVKLSAYLAGDVDRDELDFDLPDRSNHGCEFRPGSAIKWVDRDARTVTDSAGNVQRYSHLVFATGSHPLIPYIGNLHYEGVYTFRSLNEADELMARRMRSRHVVVIGGGLLGLETARAMQSYNTKITIIEHNQWLMMQHLDETGGECLKQLVEKNGVTVELGDSVVSIVGNGRVEAVSLRSGREIVCDTVIIAAGIRPNVALARDVRLKVGKGIRIDDHLKTSDENIFAIGECVEHNNSVYGLVKPGIEQASVLANRLLGGSARYIGTLESARLKVMEQTVFSVGRTGVDEESRTTVREYTYLDKENGIYRKIRVFGNRIVGAMAVGEWQESSLVQQAVQKKRNVWFWHLLRFKATGFLWGIR